MKKNKEIFIKKHSDHLESNRNFFWAVHTARLKSVKSAIYGRSKSMLFEKTGVILYKKKKHEHIFIFYGNETNWEKKLHRACAISVNFAYCAIQSGC